MATKEQILAGREAVQKYRDKHSGASNIYLTAKTPKDIGIAHNDLMAILLADLALVSFKSLQEFEIADREYRIANGEEVP